ncbi:uncharacterized protein LOC106640541 [Copidosoma floridanum]|uniref:uncharacterized protein LOC106640541 n=1 Tax=Copidosoma floridanum TaxID=29053 RepID=UPI0006C96614|nr:uncharacterized protein LOC106640541 [Copidosoma floridanum]
MPGCSGPLSNSITAASMTGSTELGPIQPQQDSVPLLDDRLFVDFNRPPSKPLRLSHRFPPSTPMTQRRGSVSHSGVQLTPLWEYVVRTKKFPKDTNVEAVFDEILERLRDPEWES